MADEHSARASYRSRFKGGVGRFFLERQECEIRKALNMVPPARILDVGGGHLQLAPLLAADGYDVVILASTEKAIGLASTDPCMRTRCVVGAFDAMPFADRSFDAVVAVRMMAHIENWPRIIGEMTRVARSRVVVDFPVRGGSGCFGELVYQSKFRIEGPTTRRYRSIGSAEMRETLIRCCFATTHEKGQFVLPMALHRLIGAEHLSRGIEKALRRNRFASRFASPVVLGATRVEHTEIVHDVENSSPRSSTLLR